jgi:CHAT domain-containing protein/tetratricopeptide (TPR) repeat protein
LQIAACDFTGYLNTVLIFGEICGLTEEVALEQQAYEQAEEQANILPDGNDKAEIQLRCAAYLCRKGRWRHALLIHRQITQHYPQDHKTDRVKSWEHFVEGEIFYASGMHSKARLAFYKSIKAARSASAPRLTAAAYARFAACFLVAPVSRALRVAHRALEEAKNEGDRNLVAEVELTIIRLHLRNPSPDELFSRLTEVASHAATSKLRAEGMLLTAEALLAGGAREEAAESTRRAGVIIARLSDSRLEMLLAKSRAMISLACGDLIGVVEGSWQALHALKRKLDNVPFDQGVGILTQASVDIAELGAHALENFCLVYGTTYGTAQVRKYMLHVWDLFEAVRCTRLRELLRLFVSGHDSASSSETMQWLPGPDLLNKAFDQRQLGILAGRNQDNQGSLQTEVRGYLRVSGWGESTQLRQIEGSEATGAELASRAFSSRKASRFPEENASSVFVSFSFVGDDLIVIPAQFLGSEEFLVEFKKIGPFKVGGVRPKIEQCVQKQRSLLGLDGRKSFPSNTDDLNLVCDLREVYEELSKTLEIGSLIDFLQDRVEGSLSTRDLVLIPGGPLLQLPLHAMFVNGNGDRLLDCVASLRYGVSLEALLLQSHIGASAVKRHVQDLQVLVFANPASQTEHRLQYVVDEVESIVSVLQKYGITWRVHGDTGADEYCATRTNLQKWHRSADILWLSGHGVGGNFMEGIDSGFELCDGLLGQSELLGGNYDFSRCEAIVVTSCLLGNMDRVDANSGNIEAFSAVLALRGCRRVISAMWPIDDACASAFGRQLISSMLSILSNEPARSSGSVYARALKQAVSDLRSCDQGRFKHEYFWAPFWLWGAG